MKIINWFKENYVLIIILIFASVLRFYHIDYQSVWLDEIHTINEANPSFSLKEIYEALLISEPHPPLYFIVVHYLFLIFGYTTFVLKVFSAIIGVVGVWSIYLFGKELFNKKVGYYSAILLTFNYFHIYYSQEGRMYCLLFLTTTFSFYFLVKFIKKANFKSAMLYCLFSTIMIYCHFFALFALVSQYIILLYFIIKPYQINSIKFFKYSIITGLSTLVLYLPTYGLIKKTSEMTSIWIPMPTLDVYTQILKDFFGQSEIVLFFITTLIFLFFIQLFKAKNNQNFKINPTEDKLVFSFLILFIWISTTLIFPLIRTYTSLPMLINRYFINILPAIIILLAIGLSFIKNKLVLYSVLLSIIIFSITDIVIVKKYYKAVNKTQFREVTQFIIKNNTKHDPVVTSLPWYFPFFLNNNIVKTTIIESTIDNQINTMILDSTKIKSFWYVDAHLRPYKPNDITKTFINKIFIENNSVSLYDCYAKHFILKKDYVSNVDISKFIPLQKTNGNKIAFSIEEFNNSENKITIVGWAYLESQGTENSKLEVIVLKDNNPKVLSIDNIKRDDVSKYFKSDFDLSNSGFKSEINKANFEKGNYQIAILISDNTTNKKGLVITDKTFVIE